MSRMRKNTIKINAPKDIVHRLRAKYPGVPDANLYAVTYQSSLMRLEVKVDNFDKRLSEVLGVKKKTRKR